MNTEEYSRMHALESNYWWFVGRRAIIASLLHTVRAELHADERQFRLLDIGCGTGANLPMLRAVAGEGRVASVDYSSLALEFAQSHPEAQNVALVQADGLRLPFADESVDVVTMLDVLEHLSDDERALQEVWRVLRPGGAYVWSVPAYQRLWSAHDEALHHFRRYELHGLSQLLRSQGFGVRRISFAMSIMPPAAWLWRRFILPFKPRRPADAKRHSEGAILPQVSPAFNAGLIAYLKAEGKIIPHRPLRFGTSLVGVAVKKPKA